MFNIFSDKQTVLLIAGGSGITFVASILEELVGQAINSEKGSGKSIRTTSIVLVWVAKSLASIKWYEAMFNSILSISSTQTNISVEIRLFSEFKGVNITTQTDSVITFSHRSRHIHILANSRNSYPFLT